MGHEHLSYRIHYAAHISTSLPLPIYLSLPLPIYLSTLIFIQAQPLSLQFALTLLFFLVVSVFKSKMHLFAPYTVCGNVLQCVAVGFLLKDAPNRLHTLLPLNNV